MLTALVWGLTLAASVWFATQVSVLQKQRRILKRVREICASPEVRESTAGTFQERWEAAGGEQLPAGWATDRVRELTRLRAGGYEVVGALSRLDRRKAGRSVTLLRVIAGSVLLIGMAG